MGYQVGQWVHVTVDNYGENVQIVEDRGGEATRYKVRDERGKEYYVAAYEISTYDSRADTLDHIGKVRARLDEAIGELQDRQRAHDASKLVAPEKSGYDRLAGLLRGGAYGSEAYHAILSEARETIQHHYANNSHHPEHYADGIAGMSLFDLIEMVADWKAASERTPGQESIAPSLARSVERWGIAPQLAQILANTIKEMGW